MTVSAWIFLTLAIVGAAFGLWQLASRRRTFRRLNALLDRAIAGDFLRIGSMKRNCLL